MAARGIAVSCIILLSFGFAVPDDQADLILKWKEYKAQFGNMEKIDQSFQGFFSINPFFFLLIQTEIMMKSKTR